jgi:hypothetical protein
MMEAVRTSETSVDNHFTRHYIPEDNSDHTRRRENLKSHILGYLDDQEGYHVHECEKYVAVVSDYDPRT